MHITCFYKKNQLNLNTLIKLQNKKVKNYFSKKNDGAIEKMLCLAAEIKGCVEQLELVNQYINVADDEKLNFVQDCSDLDFDDKSLKYLCATKNVAYFIQKYNAMTVLNTQPLVYNSFLKHSEFFINAICQLKEKQQQNVSLNELIKLKLIAIKHLCVLEYLIENK